jgi:hypothetical protein
MAEGKRRAGNHVLNKTLRSGLFMSLIPVGGDMAKEIPQQDKIVFLISKPLLTRTCLEKSRRLFEMQTEETDFDQLTSTVSWAKSD